MLISHEAVASVEIHCTTGLEKHDMTWFIEPDNQPDCMGMLGLYKRL